MDESLSEHLNRLNDLQKIIRGYKPNTSDANLINGAKMEALYHHACCTAILIEQLNQNVSELDSVMESVKQIVDKSDKKAFKIFWATVITLIITITLLINDIGHMHRVDMSNDLMNKHLSHLDSVLTSKK
jgi:hypothetical protein